MKKLFTFFLIILLTFCLLTGCSGKNNDASGKGADSGIESGSDVDIDMTQLDDIMLLAQIDNVLMEPEKYSGNTIRMRGLFRVLYGVGDEETPYTFVVVYDETQCCESGIEFRFDKEVQFPDDYPLEDTEIEITGTYKFHEDFGSPMYYIETDAIDIL